MFTVIRGTECHWLREVGGLTLTAHNLGTLLALAFGTALGANLVNNVPMIAGLIGILDHAAPTARAPLAIAAILGANLGPVVTPFGSLATLVLWAVLR